MHENSPVTSGSDEDQITIQDKADYATKLQQQERIIGKWAGLWRTITLSSLGKTLLPYSRYIRTLNLRDLEQLLQDRKFQDKFSE